MTPTTRTSWMNGMDASEARFTFETTGYGGELRVLRFAGFEGISDLFRFGVELACTDPEIDLDAVVGQRAKLSLLLPDGARDLFGIVSRFEQGVAGGTFTPYFAEVVPTLWLLTHRYASRIFQEKTTQQIIEQVLSDAGVESDFYRFALQGSYEERGYCVQYRETEWNFIARLMEEEGIFFFFEHADDKDVLVMADAADVHVPIEGESEVLFRPRTGAVEAEEYVYDFRYSQQIRPGKISVKDFNFETPALGLLKDDQADRNPELEIYEYPALHATDGRAQTLAGIRLEATQTPRLQGQGRSICRRFVPGYNFTLADFPRDDLNQEYLLTSIQHEGVQPLGQDDAGGHYEYNNHFRCVPSSVLFRPTRKTPKPVVEGSQTAIVTGPSGEEIYVDEYGRVKVQFHWDREGQYDEHTSCWIRVSQLWAGVGWGAMFIPRIGHEVIVDFIEGDPDRPIITGRVYHASNTVPYTLDDEKTKSTIKSESSLGGGGYNEIRFEDLKGEEEIFTHAQKDQNEVIENDLSITVGHDMSTKVGHDQTITVKNDRSLTVEQGNHTIKVSQGTQSTTVKGDTTLTVQAGNRVVEVTGDYKSTATGAVSITGQSGGVSVTGQGKGVTISGTGGTGVGVKGTPNFEATGAAAAKISSPSVDIGNAMIKIHGTMIELDGGGGKITIDPSGVKISGPLIDSSAAGMHNIKGAVVSVSGGVVKLNC